MMAMILAAQNNAWAEEGRNSLTFNAAYTLAMILEADYERSLAPELSVYIQPTLGFRDYGLAWYRVQSGVKLYAIDGFYAFGCGGFFFDHLRVPGDSITVGSGAISAGIGYRVSVDKQTVIDLDLGYGYEGVRSWTSSSGDQFVVGGRFFVLGVRIGGRF